MVTAENQNYPMSETVHTIASFLEQTNTHGGKFERVEFQSVFSLTPMQFLTFAKEDLMTTLRHKYINTLSNAKRAVDCHVDILLQAFGYYETAKRKNWRFPVKQAKIYEMGIAAPQILNKLNRLRNLMEHEFVDPSEDEVIDFVDVAELFIKATQMNIKRFCPYIEMENETTGLKMCFHFDNVKPELILRTYDIAYDSYTDYKNNFNNSLAPPKTMDIWPLVHADYDKILTQFVSCLQVISY